MNIQSEIEVLTDYLESLTAQEVFDKSVGGVIAQGCPAVKDDACVYLDKLGNKCAAGQLIPEFCWNLKAATATTWEGFSKLHSNWPTVHFDLISALQFSHDLSDRGNGFLPDFKRDAKRVANKFGLSWNFGE